MPNRCVRCGKIHPDDASYLVNGCNECGGSFFFHIDEETLKKEEESIKKIKLTKKQIQEIEQDIKDIVGAEEIEDGKPVILDVEAIRVLKPGKYEIDVTTLFRQKPIVIRIAPGKYKLDFSVLSIEKNTEKSAE